MPKGTLLHEMHRLAGLLDPAVDGLRVLLREAAVKHADETPWRTDGDNGYAWVFVAGRITLFVREQTRAMSLRSACAGDPVTHFVRAAFIRWTIETIALAPARHPSVQGIQNSFRENEQRLWHWTEDPRVPAENNTAERAVRPLAIERKVSHGSQSVNGRKTRSILMSILHTLNACCADPAQRLMQALDHYAKDRNTNMFARVFGGLPLYVPTQ